MYLSYGVWHELFVIKNLKGFVEKLQLVLVPITILLLKKQKEYHV